MVVKGAKRQGNYPEAQYVYKDGDKKHPYHWGNCLECGERALMRNDHKGFCSKRCSKLEDLNPSKQKASHHSLTPGEYAQAHKNVRRERGQAAECINGCTGRSMYHWANISGDYWNPSDYQPMCVPCHDRFDRTKPSTEL